MAAQPYPIIDVKATAKNPFVSADTIAFFAFEGQSLTALDIPESAAKTACISSLDAASFSGKKDQSHVVVFSGKKFIFIGLGKKETYNGNTPRIAAAKAVKTANGLGSKDLSFSVAGLSLQNSASQVIQLITDCAEAAIMASYQFIEYKSEKQPWNLHSVLLSSSADSQNVQRALFQGVVFGQQNIKARHLINGIPAVATPQHMAMVSKQVAKSYNLPCNILGKKELQKRNMNGILEVCRGSVHDPALVIMEYGKEFRKSKTYCLVGKGVCFDSGGYNIKPANAMETMKEDKAGAISVIMVLEAIARLNLPVHVYAIAPFVENLVSGSAYKPGDIIRTSSGKTIEVLNTDAEGRIILSDALTYAASLKPDAIIDVATLTGAIVIALGNNVTGMFSNSPELMEKLAFAGETTYERVWDLPMYDDYGELIVSDFADIKNVISNAPGPAGSITAAKFLEHFVDKKPWAHLDIAGTAWSDKTENYTSKGATGASVRLLTQYLIDECSGK